MEIVEKLKRKFGPQVWKVDLVMKTGSPQFRTQVEAALEAGCFEEIDAIASSTMERFYEITLPVLGEQHRLALDLPVIIFDYRLMLDIALDRFCRAKSDLEARLDAVTSKDTSFCLAGTLDREVYHTWDYENEQIFTGDLITEFHSQARKEHYRSHVDPMGIDFSFRFEEWRDERKSQSEVDEEPTSMPQVIPDNYSEWVF